MVHSGIDIYCALPVLSVFLGHQKIESTEYYLRLTREMYPEIIKMEQSIISLIFPEINLEKDLDYDNN
jgi:hypothetical protein